jgi:hypothetical protein
MNKIIHFAIMISLTISIAAQGNKTDLLQSLEKKSQADQNGTLTATMKVSARLFGAKNDLTTVILIIPSGSTVAVLDSDSTYFHVVFEENEGYIYKRQAVIDKTPVKPSEINQNQQFSEPAQTNQPQQVSRFAYLENKYGSNMAARLISGKIWKGMNSEMVKDSWGNAEKINRVISGNTIKEEWIYQNTWLYFENNTLVEWGPIQR